MMALIKVEHKISQKMMTPTYSLTPLVYAYDIGTCGFIRPLKIRHASTPPPKIATQKVARPSVPISTLKGALPKFVRPTLEGVFKISTSSPYVRPLVRTPPIMPPNAKQSGHCKMRFDVTSQGTPHNINASDCTSNIFRSAAIKSVEKWQYAPKIKNGVVLSRSGVEAMVKFILEDKKSNKTP